MNKVLIILISFTNKLKFQNGGGFMSSWKRVFTVFLCVLMLLGMFSESVFADFSDVKSSDWFSNDVRFVQEQDLMSGVGNQQFLPGENTTRGMFVAILHRLEKTPNPRKNHDFTDVKAGDYYDRAVAWANSKAIVSGYGSGKFGPNDTINREQIATILYRYAKDKGYDVGVSQDISSFSDYRNVSGFALEAMKWAYGIGLIKGVGNNQIQPLKVASRAEVAAIFKRFVQNVVSVNEEGQDFPYTRGQWIQMLAENMGMNLDIDLEHINYFFGDSKDSPYAAAIEIANAYGLIPQPEYVKDTEQDVWLFHPKKPATREFAAYTAIKAMGFEGTHKFDISKWKDLNKVRFPNEMAIAVGYELLALDASGRFNPGENLTQPEARSIFSALNKIRNSTIITPDMVHDDSEFAQSVIHEELKHITEYTVTENQGNLFTVVFAKQPGSEIIKAGAVIVLPPNDHYPTGRAFKVSEVGEEGNQWILKCTEPKIEEIFQKLDFAAYATPEIDKIRTMDGVSFEYIEGTVGEDVALRPLNINIDNSFAVPGKLKFDVNHKFGSGLKLEGSLEFEIPEVACIIDANISWGNWSLDEFTLSIQEKLKIEAKFEKLAHELSSGEFAKDGSGFEQKRFEMAKIPLRINFFTEIEFIIFLNVNINGTVSVSYEAVSKQGFQYKHGAPRVIFEFDHNLTFPEIKASAKAGIGASAALKTVGIRVVGYFLEIGSALEASFKKTITESGELYCANASSYMYCTSGLDSEYGLGKWLKDVLHYELEFEHLGNNSENPLRSVLHIENGRIVNECTLGHANIEGKVSSNDTRKPVGFARVRVYRDKVDRRHLVKTVFTDKNGKYRLNNIAAGDKYIIQISATDYFTYTHSHVKVPEVGTKYLETFLMVDRDTADTLGKVEGNVIDGVTGRLLKDVDYIIYKGWSNQGSEIVESGKLKDGKLSLDLEPGNYTLELKKPNYVDLINNFAVNGGKTSTLNSALSPETIGSTETSGNIDTIHTSGNGLRIILTWDRYPYDLDSHFFAIDTDTGELAFETYYSRKNAYDKEGKVVVNLDLDDTTSYGPETTSLYRLENNRYYRFKVHDYSNGGSTTSNQMSSLSNARVNVYSDGRLVATFHVPPEIPATWWHVFDFDPNTGEIIPIDDMTFSNE